MSFLQGGTLVRGEPISIGPPHRLPIHGSEAPDRGADAAHREEHPAARTIGPRELRRLTRTELADAGGADPADERPIDRPRTRGDCAPCPICQAHVDQGGDQDIADGPVTLACGHRAELAANRCRPCAFVACKHNLALDINPENGSIKLAFPNLEPWELEHSCALGVADAGENTLEDVARLMNVTRERVRQIEHRALDRLEWPARQNKLGGRPR